MGKRERIRKGQREGGCDVVWCGVVGGSRSGLRRSSLACRRLFRTNGAEAGILNWGLLETLKKKKKKKTTTARFRDGAAGHRH